MAVIVACFKLARHITLIVNTSHMHCTPLVRLVALAKQFLPGGSQLWREGFVRGHQGQTTRSLDDADPQRGGAGVLTSVERVQGLGSVCVCAWRTHNQLWPVILLSIVGLFVDAHHESTS